MSGKGCVLLASLLWVGVTCAGEPATDSSRDEAQQATQKFFEQLQVPELAKFRESTLDPVTTKVLSEGAKKCRDAGPPPTTGFMVYILILNADGSVSKVLGVRETPFHKCVAEAIEKAKYPAPPRAPYYSLLTHRP